ncbi:MAG: hypothetical protein ACKO7B_16275, partial [Flavobacteriales bacterium]
SNDFSSGSLVYASGLTNGNVTGVLSGSATQTGGLVQLTPNTTSQLGGFTIPASGINGRDYSIAFTIATSAAANTGADGMSYSFGDDADATSTSPPAENGSGSKLQLCFDSYDASGAGVMGIRLKYGTNVANPGSTPGSNGVLAYSSNTSWCGTSSNVVLTINSSGQATVTLGGSPIFTNVQLPAAYLTANRATWKHVFAGRTGGISQIHSVDNIVIQQSSVVQTTSSGWSSSISTTTSWLVSEINTTAGCESPGTLVTATVSTPVAISASADVNNVCPGTAVTLTATAADVNNYTYTWYKSSGPTGAGMPANGGQV